jgi:uncharacterized protein (TIGR00297 family)
VLQRVLAGFVVAALISLSARRFGALTTSGGMAATVVGTLAVVAGWNWAALLVAYFASSSALSRVGRSTKQHRTAAVVAKHGPRDARQVVANGGVFAVAALAMRFHADERWVALGAGALAASAADTWATELGTLYGDAPRSILTWRTVTVGTSGGVSAIGTLAGLGGSGFLAWLVGALGSVSAIAGAVAIGGVAGMLADSVLGATVQARRWCDACNRATERSVHDCGAATRRVGGVRWMDNDMVNLVSGAIGGVLSAMLAW